MFHVMLTLKKGEEVKYLSHRDVIRTFEFALRRGKIPISYSEGFNPRPRMSFGSAIGVGVTSEDDRIQLELTGPVEPSDIKAALNSQLPPGIRVLAAEIVIEGVKSPISKLNASEFRMSASCNGCDLTCVKEAIAKLFSSESIRVKRNIADGGTKEVEIRPHLLSAEAAQEENGDLSILVTLGYGHSGGAGPKDFVQAMTKVLPNLRVGSVHRVRQTARE